MDATRRADRLRVSRLVALLAAHRDALPVASSLALQVSAEVARLMLRRGETWRSLDVAGKKLRRCLKAENVTTATIDELAAALNCDAVIQFVPRWRSAAIKGSSILSATTDRPHSPCDDTRGDSPRDEPQEKLP